jgi:hypothetical protein
VPHLPGRQGIRRSVMGRRVCSILRRAGQGCSNRVAPDLGGTADDGRIGPGCLSEERIFQRG